MEPETEARLVDTRAALATRWAEPARRLHPVFARPGFPLPALDGLSWTPMPGNGRNNWIVGDGAPHRYVFDVAEGNDNNILVISPGSTCHGNVFVRGSDNLGVLIGAIGHSNPVHLHFHSSNHIFYFGPSATSNTATFELGGDGTSILVGEDCMFSAFIFVFTDDHHAIVDLETGVQVNAPGDVIFHPHVWVGINCMILKGVEVGFGSVLGACSVVTGSVAPMTIVAGSPAAMLRSNVSWVRNRNASRESRDWLLTLARRYSQ